MFENDTDYADFFEKLATLSLEAENFEIALAALKLQSALKATYGSPYLLSPEN